MWLTVHTIMPGSTTKWSNPGWSMLWHSGQSLFTDCCPLCALVLSKCTLFQWLRAARVHSHFVSTEIKSTQKEVEETWHDCRVAHHPACKIVVCWQEMDFNAVTCLTRSTQHPVTLTDQAQVYGSVCHAVVIITYTTSTSELLGLGMNFSWSYNIVLF